MEYSPSKSKRLVKQNTKRLVKDDFCRSAVGSGTVDETFSDINVVENIQDEFEFRNEHTYMILSNAKPYSGNKRGEEKNSLV